MPIARRAVSVKRTDPFARGTTFSLPTPPGLFFRGTGYEMIDEGPQQDEWADRKPRGRYNRETVARRIEHPIRDLVGAAMRLPDQEMVNTVVLMSRRSPEPAGQRADETDRRPRLRTSETRHYGPGSDGGADHWAIAMTLDPDSEAERRQSDGVLGRHLERVVSGRTTRNELHTLLPWNWISQHICHDHRQAA